MFTLAGCRCCPGARFRAVSDLGGAFFRLLPVIGGLFTLVWVTPLTFFSESVVFLPGIGSDWSVFRASLGGWRVLYGRMYDPLPFLGCMASVDDRSVNDDGLDPYLGLEGVSVREMD